MVYLPRDEAGFNRILYNAQRGAMNRKIVWDLTDEQARGIFDRDCFYCGDRPKLITQLPDRKAPIKYAFNGIDRIDSSKGYTTDNTVSCCTQCNYMKRNYSQGDFLRKARDIASRHPA